MLKSTYFKKVGFWPIFLIFIYLVISCKSVDNIYKIDQVRADQEEVECIMLSKEFEEMKAKK